MAALFFAAATLLTVLGLPSSSFAITTGSLGRYNTYPHFTSTYQGTNYPGYYGGWRGYGAHYPIKQTVSSVTTPVGYGGWGLSGLGYGLNSYGYGLNGYGYGLNGLGYGLNGYGYGLNGLGYGLNGLGYGLNGVGYGLNGVGYGLNGVGYGLNGLGYGLNGVGYGLNGVGYGLNGLGYGLSYPVRSSVSTSVTRPATYGGWGGSGYGLTGLKYLWGGLRYSSPYSVGPVSNYVRPVGYGGMFAGASGYYPMGAFVRPMTNFGLGSLYGGYGTSPVYGGQYPTMFGNFGRYY